MRATPLTGQNETFQFISLSIEQKSSVSPDKSDDYITPPNRNVNPPEKPPQLESTAAAEEEIFKRYRVRFPDGSAAPGLARMIPVVGFASCGLKLWYKGRQDLGEVPAAFDLLNDRSFAVKAIGMSMMPEGIRPGYLCFCNPLRPVGKRDAVYVVRKDGTATIKLYVGMTEKGWYHLQGWLDPDRDGHQDTFLEQINPDWVHEIAPVLYVRRAP